MTGLASWLQAMAPPELLRVAWRSSCPEILRKKRFCLTSACGFPASLTFPMKEKGAAGPDFRPVADEAVICDHRNGIIEAGDGTSSDSALKETVVPESDRGLGK